MLLGTDDVYLTGNEGKRECLMIRVVIKDVSVRMKC